VVVCGGQALGSRLSCEYLEVDLPGGVGEPLKRWKHHAVLPSPHISGIAQVHDTTLRLLGGSLNPLGVLEVDEDGSVREVASHLKPTMAACSVVLPGGDFIVAGGAGNPLPLDSVFRYDVNGNVIELGRLATGRMNHGCYLYSRGGSTLFIVAGGHDGAAKLASTEVLNINDGTWKCGGDMNIRRQGVRLAAVNGDVFALGGKALDLLDSVEQWIPESCSWKTMSQKLLHPRAFHAVVEVPGTIFKC